MSNYCTFGGSEASKVVMQALVDLCSLCRLTDHRMPSQLPPSCLSPSRSWQLGLKPAICKAGANGHECISLWQNAHEMTLQHETTMKSQCTVGGKHCLCHKLIPLKLQCLRMKKRHISSRSASVIGLGGLIDLVGELGLFSGGAQEGCWGLIFTSGSTKGEKQLKNIM